MTITSVQNRTQTWDQLLRKVREDDQKRVDFNTTWQDLGVLPADRTDPPLMTHTADTGPDSKLMSVRAYRQYLAKLGIQHRQTTLFSGDLQGRMIRERLDFLDPGTQKPLVDPDAAIFLRTRPNQIRAILSGRYGNMRDVAVAEIVDKLLPDLQNYSVLRGRVADHVFSVTLIGRESIYANGDSYYPIHVIQNSEVGASSFRVSSGVCKGACSNGMIFGHRKDCSHRIRHLGANMADKVVAALNEALGSVQNWGGMIGEAIAAAKNVVFDLSDDKDKAKAVSKLRSRGLTKKLSKQVVDFSLELPQEVYGTEFLTNGQLTTEWGIINAMTHLAQDVNLFGEIERHDLEEAAGQLLLVRRV